MKVIKKLFFLSVLVMSFYACSTDELNAPTEETVRTNEIVHRTLTFEEFYSTFSNQRTLLGEQIHTLAQTRKEHLKKAYSQSSATADTTKQIVVDYYYDPIHSNETYSFITKEFNTKGDYLEKFVVTIEDGERKSGYLRYYPAGDTIEELFTGRVEITNAAQTISFNSSFENGVPDQRTTYGVMDDCTARVSFGSTLCSNGGLHKYGEACKPPYKNDAYMYVIVEVVCKNTIPSNVQEMPHQIIDIKPGKTGGSGGTSSATIKFENFVNILSAETKNWLLENHDIKLIISGYLVQQNFSEDSKQNATTLLNFIANDNVLKTNNNRLTEYLIRSSLMGTEFNTQQFIDFWSALTTGEKNILQQYVNSNLTAGYFPVIKPSVLTFLNWAFPYLINNEQVTIKQFENWFMTSTNGKDGEYDAEYWENPNLIIQQQNLPSWSDFEANFPKENGGFMSSSHVYELVGGQLYNNHLANPSSYGNACAIRVSRALNYSGIVIPDIPGQTEKGSDNKNYFLSAKNLNAWMQKTFGKPTGTNHLTGAQGGTNGKNFPTLLASKKGIYIMIANYPGPNYFGATGHADILENGTCPDDRCYFNPKGGVHFINVWELN